ncbi:transcriptional regulator GutM [Yersinia ruckeri]|uniref:transcriptional regulator GutM n=1 Tax=Yersinia ruckeri TaxID=29486 RepID=UPI0011A197E6|nr:transcriptional regulator GutM [Yersinia ruckeri]EKN3347933.1 transcriptional regulator GutM [Yersinia ruckeri]EKN3363151.1 transcriptional regulator GutM [Yersinia ruckeri]EKN4202886.1 transcriptional regulator GutM [Yersinia ruckeri]EKN4208904.1 transcriptional regulator GutM [Yersinia ruckeri]EKN4699405.1 transcriptional regulator GutM [Yersinia ruckeri]
MINSLITLAVIAWLSQMLLGGWQIRQFNQAFDRLCRSGAVGLGRSSGRFKPRVVIALAFDEQQNVRDSLMMKGLTIFSRPRAISQIHGMNRQELQPDVIFPYDQNCQNALSLALKLK